MKEHSDRCPEIHQPRDNDRERMKKRERELKTESERVRERGRKRSRLRYRWTMQTFIAHSFEATYVLIDSGLVCV